MSSEMSWVERNAVAIALTTRISLLKGRRHRLNLLGLPTNAVEKQLGYMRSAAIKLGISVSREP